MRGVILPRLFEANGFRVYTEPGGGCKPRRYAKSHARVAEVLAKRGCGEIASINEEYCVSRGTIDVDFAAYRGGALLVAEVKTRLVIREHGRSYLLDMLRYHLSEPSDALEAWRRLEALGKVKPRRCGEPARGEYDSPGSIAELIRSAIALYLLDPSLFQGRSVALTAVTMCYARPYANAMLGFVERAAAYLARCTGWHVEPAVILLEPDPSVFADGRLGEVRVECRGSGCNLLGNIKPLRQPLRGCEEECNTCISCKYNARCRGLCGAHRSNVV